MKSLNYLIAELEKSIPYINHKKEAISKVSVGWHIEHTLLALVKMISSVEQSNPAAFKNKFNLKRTFVLAMGKIPRGKGRAPDAVKPGHTISEETIRPLVEKAKQKAEQLEKFGSDKFLTHPVFGDLKLKKARKIIYIHTFHHIQIINEIIRN